MVLLALLVLLPLVVWAQNQLPPGTQAPDGEGQIRPQAQSPRDAAESKIEQKDFEGARSLLVKYLSEHPTDARALFDLGYVEDAGSHEDAAAADYRKAIAADPKQFEARLALGLLLAHQGKYDEAREQMEQATLADPGAAQPCSPGRSLPHAGGAGPQQRPSGCPGCSGGGAEAQPRNPRRPAADRSDRRSERRFRTGADGLPALAGKPAAALASLAAAATGGLAQLLIKQKKYSEAEPLLKTALARDPRDPALNAQLAAALLAQGKNDQALPVLETLRQLEPGNDSVDQMLADAYSQAGHPEKAEPIYAKMALAHPGNEDVLAAQGENLIRERLYPQAQEVLQRAVKLKPDDGDAWSGLAFAASENKQYQVTLQALSMRSKYLAETPATYFLWATAYDSLHVSKSAQEYYRKFLTASDGKFPDQEWQAKHRLVALGGNH